MSLEWLKTKVARLEEAMANKVMAVAEYTTLSRTSAAGDKDFANVAANPNDRQRPIRRVSPWGIVGHPPAGVFALIVKAVGGVFNGINAGIATDKYGPQDLDEGETAVYNITAALVRLWKTGKITVDADAGQDIVFNAGTKKVARVADLLAVGSIAGIAGPFPVTITYVPMQDVGGADTPGIPIVGPTVNLAGIVSNAGGAPHVKG
jgi:phage gp45-like